ncbi:MAG: substrate-binding domain-containing protein [Bacteroidia bacterium]
MEFFSAIQKAQPKMRKNAVIFSIVFLIFGCQNYNYEGRGNDVPTAGSIKVGFEHGDSLLVVQWIEIFEMMYPKAHVIPQFGSYNELVNLWINDSIQGVFLHKEFNQEELNWLKQKKNATVNKIPLGETSTAFVTQKASNIDSLTLTEIRSMLNGKTFRNISKFYYTGKNSSDYQNIDTILIRLGYTRKGEESNKGENIQLVNLVRDEECLNQLEESSLPAIAMVSLNSIADSKDPTAIEHLKKLKVLKVENHRNEFHLPFQSQISAKQYPFRHTLFSYESQGYSGLIKGFVIYTNTQSGQALLQKSGLFPLNSAGRRIQIDVN